MSGSTSFPGALDNNTNLDETLQDNVDEVVVAHIINAYAAIKALQTKVGITDSAVSTTFDYLRNVVLNQNGLNVDLAGTLDVTGAVIFDSTLTVTGAVVHSSTLNVVGNADFDANVNIDGALVVDTTASVGGILTVHADNFDVPAENSGLSQVEGVATTFARSDHNHGVSAEAPGWLLAATGTVSGGSIAFTSLSTSVKGWRVTGVLLGVATPEFSIGGGASLIGGTWYANNTGTLSHASDKDDDIGNHSNLTNIAFELLILKDGTNQGFYKLSSISENDSTNTQNIFETRGLVSGNAITSITVSGSIDATGSFAILESLNA